MPIGTRNRNPAVVTHHLWIHTNCVHYMHACIAYYYVLQGDSPSHICSMACNRSFVFPQAQRLILSSDPLGYDVHLQTVYCCRLCDVHAVHYAVRRLHPFAAWPGAQSRGSWEIQSNTVSLAMHKHAGNLQCCFHRLPKLAPAGAFCNRQSPHIQIPHASIVKTVRLPVGIVCFKSPLMHHKFHGHPGHPYG